MNIQNIGKSDGYYNLIPSKMNDFALCLEAKTPNTEQFKDGLYISDSLVKNCRMFYYKVIKCGSKVDEAIGVREGDYIFIDMLARYADTFPISFTHTGGVLFKTDENAKDKIALRGKILVKYNRVKEKVNSFGLIETNGLDPYGTVISIGEGCEDRGFKVGDRVSVTNNMDAGFSMSDGVFYSYDYTAPLFKYVED